METRAVRWAQLFPYRDGQVLIVRLPRGWRLGLGGTEAQATDLVSAFESLRRRPAGAAELRVVLAALARDRVVA